MNTQPKEKDFLKTWAIFVACTITAWFLVAIAAGAVLATFA